MKAVVYSKPDCPYCEKIKVILFHCAIEYKEYIYGRDFDRTQFYAEFGEGSTFPQVLLDNKHIGGCTDTIKYLKEQNLV
jgi:glutaredoxin